jgi:hypothetical protein
VVTGRFAAGPKKIGNPAARHQIAGVLANLLQLFARRAAREDYDRAFVREVRPVVPRVARSRRSERVLVIGWALIALKCWGVWWLLNHVENRIHLNAWWINGPTLASATLVTVVYLRRP